MYGISLKDCDGEEIYSCELNVDGKNVDVILDEVVDAYAESRRDGGYRLEFNKKSEDSTENYDIVLRELYTHDEVYEASNYDITGRTVGVGDIINEIIDLYVESLKEDTYSIEFTKMKE